MYVVSVPTDEREAKVVGTMGGGEELSASEDVSWKHTCMHAVVCPHSVSASIHACCQSVLTVWVQVYMHAVVCPHSVSARYHVLYFDSRRPVVKP